MAGPRLRGPDLVSVSSAVALLEYEIGCDRGLGSDFASCRRLIQKPAHVAKRPMERNGWLRRGLV